MAFNKLIFIIFFSINSIQLYAAEQSQEIKTVQAAYGSMAGKPPSPLALPRPAIPVRVKVKDTHPLQPTTPYRPSNQKDQKDMQRKKGGKNYK